MLELSDESALIRRLWDEAKARVELPDAERQKFLAARGPMRLHYENHRKYHRYYLRARAILHRGDSTFGAYTTDVSRQGIGFLSPVQLLPRERVQLRLPTSVVKIEVLRCHRSEYDAFEIGARFLLDDA